MISSLPPGRRNHDKIEALVPALREVFVENIIGHAEPAHLAMNIQKSLTVESFASIANAMGSTHPTSQDRATLQSLGLSSDVVDEIGFGAFSGEGRQFTFDGEQPAKEK